MWHFLLYLLSSSKKLLLYFVVSHRAWALPAWSFFFFFFGWEICNFNQLKKRNNRERKQEHYKQLSSIIRCSTNVGKDLFQTWEAPEFLATLQVLWATLLPSLFRWWKEHQINAVETSLMFQIICPSSPPDYVTITFCLIYLLSIVIFQ